MMHFIKFSFLNCGHSSAVPQITTLHNLIWGCIILLLNPIYARLFFKPLVGNELSNHLDIDLTPKSLKDSHSSTVRPKEL